MVAEHLSQSNWCCHLRRE